MTQEQIIALIRRNAEDAKKMAKFHRERAENAALPEATRRFHRERVAACMGNSTLLYCLIDEIELTAEQQSGEEQANG